MSLRLACFLAPLPHHPRCLKVKHNFMVRGVRCDSRSALPCMHLWLRFRVVVLRVGTHLECPNTLSHDDLCWDRAGRWGRGGFEPFNANIGTGCDSLGLRMQREANRQRRPMFSTGVSEGCHLLPVSWIVVEGLAEGGVADK